MKEENLDEKVPVRAYTKADLAMLYNPGVCITTALQLLRRWIYANRQLMSELKEAGYTKNRHSYLLLEGKLIVKYLGEP